MSYCPNCGQPIAQRRNCTKADRSKLLSKSEYDEQMRQEVGKLKAQGKMPSLEEVLEIFQQVLEEHANRGTIKLHPPRPKGGRS